MFMVLDYCFCYCFKFKINFFFQLEVLVDRVYIWKS